MHTDDLRAHLIPIIVHAAFIITSCLFCAGVSYGSEPHFQITFDGPESFSASSTCIEGAAGYTNGVSGKSLIFDGYKTEIRHDEKEAMPLGNAFTITAWVAPQEYSLNLSAIINQQRDFKEGYFLGIDNAGYLIGALAVGKEWKQCKSAKPLPLLKWSHIGMTFDATAGISLFINGTKIGVNTFTGRPVYASKIELCIGKTQTKMPAKRTERKSSKGITGWMYFDGLIDELTVYESVLTATQMEEQFKAVTLANPQPLQFRRMPSGPDTPMPFGAYYCRLRYAPGWDALWKGSDLPDIVVRFDNSPVKLVFWRGSGYIPGIVTENGIWMTDQSGENFGGGECWEAMGDKQCRYSHVRLIENTPARVIIHWRYALASIAHKIKFETQDDAGDWMDEYWIAYPDGVVARKQVMWSEYRNPSQYQFQETIFFNQPGTKPQDNVEYKAITFLDMDGGTASYDWSRGAPKSFPEPKHKPIEMVNTKSKYKPFSIHHPERFTRPFNFGWVKGYSTFPCWNHWPVCQFPSDGRRTIAPDKPSHSSLTAVNGHRQKYERFSDGSIRVRSLIGMTQNAIDSLLPLARSWNNPPKATAVSPGYIYKGYDQYQRCYIFAKQADKRVALTFQLDASEASPIVNVPILIEQWGSADADILVNGKQEEPRNTATGTIHTLQGSNLVVWIERTSTSTTTITIKEN